MCRREAGWLCNQRAHNEPKHQHWRGFQAENALGASPMLVFHLGRRQVMLAECIACFHAETSQQGGFPGRRATIQPSPLAPARSQN
jgi:hypothetical protein